MSIAVSIPWNLILDNLLLFNSFPYGPVSLSVSTLEKLAPETLVQMKLIFSQLQTANNNVLCPKLEQLNRRHTLEKRASVFVDKCSLES